MASAIAGLALTLALAIAGGAALELGFSEQGASANSRRGARLELVPHTTAYLRVVAEPWAVVFVDGQKIDTTPIARPIPLEAGVHYVRLEHPDAPAELRTVQLAAGETLLLDVAMKVPNAPPPPKPPVQTQQAAASASAALLPDSGP
jgi:serine/threonine-protein kinase